MNIFTFFSDKIAAKYIPKRTKLHHLSKKFRGSMPRTANPPNKRLTSPRAAWRFAPCIYPHFRKLDWTFPPKWNPKYAPAEMHLKCSREHKSTVNIFSGEHASVTSENGARTFFFLGGGPFSSWGGPCWGSLPSTENSRGHPCPTPIHQQSYL